MNLLICLDDNGGMLFNRRRQSRDKGVCGKISELSRGGRLFMSEYSARLFPQAENIIIADDPTASAQSGDFCFAEQRITSLDGMEYLYIFGWNRVYPADVYFAFDLKAEGFIREQVHEFKGSSHQITLEIYRRVDR